MPEAETTPVDEEALLAERVEEFYERRRKGEAVSVQNFVASYPDMREELLELLPAVEEMDSLGRGTRPPAPVLASYPERLGDYRLLDRLGSGGMGTVFRAMQESLKREVAVKVLAPAWNADARHSEAFENESRLIAGLRHTNIVEVYGAGQEGDYRYYVMALVKGRGLSVGQLGRSFPGVPYEQAVAQVGLQAAKALAFAHAHGVLHRDVKPGNLLLDDDGVVHVSDFGLATALNAGELAPLVTQSLDGTLRYMAPERLMKGINSFAGDQYSLGLTLYELINRSPAFQVSEPGKLVHTICHESVALLRGKGELGAIINKAISYDEGDRYASMDAMVEDLKRYLEGRPVLARPASMARRYWLWVRRRPAVAAWSHAAALLVLLLFASVSWGYVNVRRSLQNENEQRRLAENNAQIADAALLRIFSGLSTGGATTLSAGDMANGENIPSHADTRLMQDLLPYYEEIAAQGEQGGSKVARACRVLADISLQVEEYATAETYYRRVSELEQPYSLAGMECVNGLASAFYGQGKGVDARKLLAERLDQLPADAPFEVRLVAVRSMELAAGLGALPPTGVHGDKSPRFQQQGAPMRRSFYGNGERAPHPAGPRPPFEEKEARQWLDRASALLAELLKERPDDPTARLRQVELLSLTRSPETRRLLSPNGENPLAILSKLLEQYPDVEDYRMAYLRLALQNRRNGGDEGSLKQAADYAVRLLAARPGDSERIMLYLSTRDRYAASLARRGQTDAAAKENERTLGVLEYLTTRADFTPELRERIISLVSHRPPMGQDSTQREEELRTLLQNYDESRISTLRRMFNEQQQRFMRRNRLPGGERRKMEQDKDKPEP